MYFCSGLRKYSQTKQWRCFQLRPQERHIHLKNAAVHIREPFTGLCEPCVLAHQRRKMEISPSTPLWWFVFLFRTDSECFFFPFRVNWFSACLCSVSQRLWQWRRLQQQSSWMPKLIVCVFFLCTSKIGFRARFLILKQKIMNWCGSDYHWNCFDVCPLGKWPSK